MGDGEWKRLAQESTRVWYEPSPGLRFAGVILGGGTLAGTCRVRLTGHYRQWKTSDGRCVFRSIDAPAIASAALTQRDSKIDELDTDGGE